MKIINFFLSCLLLTTPLFAAKVPPTLTRGNQTFAYKLYDRLNTQGENLLIAPFSISSSLAMTSLGAEKETFRQMCKVLRLPHCKRLINRSFLTLTKDLSTEGATTLTLLNGLWLQDGMSTPQQNLQLFSENLHFVDFESDPEYAAEEINLWVSEGTNGLIQGMIPAGSLDQNSRLVLVNTIYLKAPWLKTFDPEMSYEASFYGTKEIAQSAVYMNQTGNFSYGRGDNYELISLPLQKDGLEMVVVLPNDDVDLSEVKLPRRAHFEEKMIDLHLPKFAVNFKASLKEPLQNMGMNLPFDEAGGFPFGEGKVVITDVIHQAFLEVDEGGVLAAAATATEMGTTSVEELEPFIVNRPFLFAIKDSKTNTFLFMGKVENL